MRIAALGLTLLLTVPRVAGAQGVSARMSHLFDAGGLTSYQLAWDGPILGVLGGGIGGTLWDGPAIGERRAGLSVDASLFRGGAPGFYAVGGVAGGRGFGGAESWWSSWSAGLGYELMPASFLSLGLEGRWHELAPSGMAGAEFAVRLGTMFGGRRGERPVARRASAPPTPEHRASEEPGTGLLMTASGSTSSPPSTDAERVLDDVIRIAEAQVGTPYQWGGTGDGDDGFDCSGLIQYAYGEVGIELPRRSVEQARAGDRVPRRLDALRPGDILTFARSGRRITHVGLYVGDGRFIHSASKGVQISRLSPDDPYGRWFYTRWIGARRVVEPAP